MFADDIALLSSTPIGLQNQLNVLYEVANRLGLLVNLEKTKIVVFRNGGGGGGGGRGAGGYLEGQRDGTIEVSLSLLLVRINILV